MKLSEKLIRLPIDCYAPAIEMDSLVPVEDSEDHFTMRPKNQPFAGENAVVRVEAYKHGPAFDPHKEVKAFLKGLFGKPLQSACVEADENGKARSATYVSIYKNNAILTYVICKGEQAGDCTFMARVEVDVDPSKKMTLGWRFRSAGLRSTWTR